jgi:DNA mismatch repair protein MutL
MSDIIQLLPDSVANQIAAGEVIQRPASVVKELLENSVDAGGKNIEVIIKDSGKASIQIIDNGSGMTPTDARMAFERHATSKLRSADDLFAIRTMGFRGEALASIAAISHVELKSRKHNDELGTLIEIEGNVIKSQAPTNASPGTSISVKNIFYNVPARRNFLKSNTIESKHIIDEFERVAYANPEIAFSLNQNGILIFQLPVSNFKQRIININGSAYNERLVPVEEETSLLSIRGYIGKPEFCKKTRGEQFFFVNKRFIKDSYLHHAVSKAYDDLLPNDSYASYWLSIEIDPSRIDINIHPTKTEIKFDDERSVYAIIRSAIKKSLGMYSVSPTLNFEHEKSFDVPFAMRYKPVDQPGLRINTGFNPFDPSTPLRDHPSTPLRDHPSTTHGDRNIQGKSIAISGWQNGHPSSISQSNFKQPQEELLIHEENNFDVLQMGQFILCPQPDGLLIFDIPAARERLLYNRYLDQLNSAKAFSQQSLFPQTINFSPSDFQIMKEISPDINKIGFDIQEFGANCYAIHGIPTDLEVGTEKEILESLLEQYKQNSSSPQVPGNESPVPWLKVLSIRKNINLSNEEMRSLINECINLDNKYKSLGGKSFMTLLKTDEITDRFR